MEYVGFEGFFKSQVSEESPNTQLMNDNDGTTLSKTVTGPKNLGEIEERL